jgi:hypothetical protein
MKGFRFVCSLALAVLLMGCATTSQRSWESRVGKLTYDQALTELGPPAKLSKTRGGIRVAEWRLHAGSPGLVDVLPQVGAPPPGNMASRTPIVVPGTPARYLRLTFSPDGKLIAWADDVRFHE